jgi:hypothetical protein
MSSLPSLPFSKDVFNDNALHPARLLPATARTAVHTLTNPSEDIQTFLKKDLCVGKLNKIDQYLWLAGLPTPPKPLNYQLATSRQIAVDERIDLHLVWEHSRKIHLKPLPRYLLDPVFWESNLICRGPCCAAADRIAAKSDSQACSKEIKKCALGFLCSYVALIQFESDYAIAREYKLIPENITWDMWLKLVHQLLKSDALNPANINSRYLFGELRLSRLNKIYAICHGHVLSGYQYTYQTYAELFYDYITPLTAATIYVALVLTAMQVGLATTRLGTSLTFLNASYGFTVFAILAPLIGILLVGVMGSLAFTNNMMATWRLKRQKFALYEQIVAQNHLP